jgi:hypothetical protein
MTSVLLYKGYLGDVSDPDVYASGIVLEWEESEAGKWAKKHTNKEKLWYTTELDLGYKNGHAVVYNVKVYGNMKDRDYTFYQLKWGYEDLI